MIKPNSRPGTVGPIAVSMGDPAGIGPEIILKAWKNWISPDRLAKTGGLAQPLWVAGHPSFFEAAQAASPALSGLTVTTVDTPQQACELWVDNPRNQSLVVVRANSGSEVDEAQWPSAVLMGKVSAAAGRWAAQSIAVAAAACLAGQARGMVTAPIHKVAFEQAGYAYPGHTEFLQALAAEHHGVPVEALPVRMLLANTALQTVLLSIHVSLRDALALITAENLRQTIEMTDQSVPAIHAAKRGTPLAKPRIAVAGVNPHAGESGRFGREELDVMAPVIAAAQAQGIDVHGPISPDTVFMRARLGEFDVVIAAYHDQGLIPVKYLGVDEGVNVTLGLPFIRTSPDHGTAFEIAGQGLASPESLSAALDWLDRWVT